MAKVLLVEDDNNLREIFEMRLQAEGYDTVTAADGEEALVKAMKEKPDLLIADIMMPKLSGFEMLETLRAAPEMNDVKVVIMTALGQAEDRARGEKLGVVKYLVKSQVTLEDFVRVVREVLQPDQADAASIAAPATDSVGTSSTTNMQESEKAMQDDNSQQNNPAAGADSGSNPISGNDSGTSDAAGASGQQSAAEEQHDVDEKVNDFAGGAPSMPDSGSAAGGSSDASSSASSDVPVSSPPAEGGESSSGDSPAGGSSDAPAAPVGGSDDTQV